MSIHHGNKFLEEYDNQVIGILSEDEKNVASEYFHYTVDAKISFGPSGSSDWDCDCCIIGPYICIIYCILDFILSSCGIYDACNLWWFPSIVQSFEYCCSEGNSSAEGNEPILIYACGYCYEGCCIGCCPGTCG